MNRQKGSIGWALVWGFFLLAGGMILYAGYLGVIYVSSQERIALTTSENDQAVTAHPTSDRKTGPTALVTLNPAEEMTELDQAGVTNPANKELEIQEETKIKDFPCPVQGGILRSVGNYYSEAFDDYLFHAGVDYAEPEGTMIRATHGGKVIFSGADSILGQKVTLDCGEGWVVTYGGLDNLRVKVGDIVENKDALGQIGFYSAAEGKSDQPLLHYEVWRGNEVQRPS